MRNRGNQGLKSRPVQNFKGVGTAKEGRGFADVRKKQIVRNYRKFLQKEGRNTRQRRNETHSTLSFKRMSAFQKAQEEYKKAKEEQERQRKEREEKLKEKAEAMKRYKEKKIQRFKKLSMKTKHGQPVMKGRLQLLLEQIKQTVGNKSTG